jgi:hypothetical protein
MPRSDESPSAHLKAEWRRSSSPEKRRAAALSLLSWSHLSLAWAEAEVMRREGPVREAVAMCADSGVTYAEMADLLGTTNATAYRRFGPKSGRPS